MEGIDPLLQSKINKFQADEGAPKQTALEPGSPQAFAYKILKQVLRKTTQAAVFVAEKI